MTRTGYTIPIAELSTAKVHLPGGLAANPTMHLDHAAGVLRVQHDVTAAAIAAYDAMPISRRRRMAYDQEGMDPRGVGNGSAIVNFLRARLDPQDWVKLQAMINGGNGNGESPVEGDEPTSGNLPSPLDQLRRREEGEQEPYKVGARDRPKFGQDAALLQRYPTFYRLKDSARR